MNIVKEAIDRISRHHHDLNSVKNSDGFRAVVYFNNDAAAKDIKVWSRILDVVFSISMLAGATFMIILLFEEYEAGNFAAVNVLILILVFGGFCTISSKSIILRNTIDKYIFKEANDYAIVGDKVEILSRAYRTRRSVKICDLGKCRVIGGEGGSASIVFDGSEKTWEYCGEESSIVFAREINSCYGIKGG